jgi:hypothetical protein
MIKKMKYAFLCLVTLVTIQVSAQKLSKDNYKQIQKAEAAIKEFGKAMIIENEWFDRFKADSFFTRGFVQALKTPNSFYYAFDSLQTISKLYAPDSSFRIFTWQVVRDFEYNRQRGAIQIRTDDGSLKLIPLFDYSDFTKAPNDSLRDNQHWIGAIYYKILLNTFNDKKIYTLLGYDDNSARSNKKWIEILTFNTDGKPQFGGKFFQYKVDSIKPAQPAYRFSLEYKKEAKARLNYDDDAQLIVFDHLASESNEIQNKYTLIPDGTYEAFRWINGKWQHITKLDNQVLGNGNAPLEEPLYDENGNVNQKKLDEQSKKNKEQEKIPAKVDKRKPVL